MQSKPHPTHSVLVTGWFGPGEKTVFEGELNEVITEAWDRHQVRDIERLPIESAVVDADHATGYERWQFRLGLLRKPESKVSAFSTPSIIGAMIKAGLGDTIWTCDVEAIVALVSREAT